MASRILNYRLLDVFADSPLKGNQLAVFLDTGELSVEEMQEIAREMNLSETTFVLNPEDDAHSPGGIRARIFTVEEELPFAGHPTLGTSFVLQEILGRKEISLSLKVGKVDVTFIEGEKGLYGEMVQPEPVFGKTHRREDIAEILRISQVEIDESIPIESVSTGNEFIIVPLKHKETLEKIQPDFGLMDKYIEEHGGHFFYLVSRETVDKDAILHARMIFYGGEDPATGSAAGPAAAWLLKHGILPPEMKTFIEQGIEMKRPSRIYVQGSLKNGIPTDIRVGGYCFNVGSGNIIIPNQTQ